MRKIKENAKEIDPAKLADLRENAIGILAECRRELINNFPFIGSLAMNMDIVPTRDARCSTAATDGRTIYFDIDFLGSLSADDRKFILGHEIYHALLAHQLRRENRDPKIFNICTDCEVNNILKLDGLPVPSDALLPEQFGLTPGGSAEEFYEILVDQSSTQSKVMKSYMKCHSGQMPGNGGSGDGDDGSDSPQDGSSEPKEDNSVNGNGKSGNQEGKLSGQFDRHLDKNDNVHGEDIPENLADRFGKVGRDPNFCPEVKEDNAEKMRESAVAAAQVYERQRGELPAHLKQFVEELLTPEIPWQEVLQSFITRTVGAKSDWNRPNRRFVSSKIYLPSHTSETINVGVILDTSGSTAPDMEKFLSEVNSLVSSFSGYTLTLVQCDAAVQSCETYSEDNPLDMEHQKLEVHGGGGTMMTPAFRRIMEDDDIEVDCIVCFTDGFIEKIPESMVDIPTLWVVSKDGSLDELTFGEKVKMEN